MINLKEKDNILYDVNCDIKSFMPSPTVFRNLIFCEKWDKDKTFILSTHKFFYIERQDNYFVNEKKYNYSLYFCLKNKLLKKRNIIEFCFKKLLSKVQDKFSLFDNLLTYKIYKKLIKKYSISYIVRGTTCNDGIKALIKIKKRFNVDFSVILTDPIFYFPKTNGKNIFCLEKKIIEASDHYFVPEFCYETYMSNFNNNKILSFCFPMALHLEQCLHFETQTLTFSYFGTVRKNYHIFDHIFLYIQSKKCELKFYGWTIKNLSDRVGGTYLKPVLGSELIKELCKADFLIVIDNQPSMTDLLPSKIVLYASTTKPIIIFGENDDSALLKFLKKIKYERYIYIKPTDSFDSLDKFIKEYSNVSFDEECYKRQSDYYPSNVSLKFYKELFGR